MDPEKLEIIVENMLKMMQAAGMPEDKMKIAEEMLNKCKTSTAADE